MQPQKLNPFPVTDGKSSEAPVAPPPVPMPTPISSPTPAPAAPSSPRETSPKPDTKAVFVQPASPEVTHDSLKPHGPLAKLESLGVRLFSYPQIQLPDYLRDMVARMLPWLTVMMCVILAPLVLVGLAMGGFLGFLTSFYDINTNPFYWVTVVLLLAQLVLMIIAVPKLLKELRKGWSLLFTTSVLGILTVLTNIFAQFVSPLVALLAGLFAFSIVLYVLFQTRSYYTN